MALSKSLPTPNTQELPLVVVSDAVGAPERALFVATAPIAPEPFVPDVSAPIKLMTVIEDATLCVRVADTDTLFKGAAAKARQISAVPFCTLLLATNTHVKPQPEMLLTVMLGLEEASVEIKANNNSLPVVVENAGLVIVELAEP